MKKNAKPVQRWELPAPGYGLLCKLISDLLIFLLALYALYLPVLLLPVALGIYS